MVDIVGLFYRVFMFIMILSLTIFISLRVKRYPKNLRHLMLLAAIFSGIGTFGRFIDILVLFVPVPFAPKIHIITHIVSVGGIIWVFILIMLLSLIIYVLYIFYCKNIAFAYSFESTIF